MGMNSYLPYLCTMLLLQMNELRSFTRRKEGAQPMAIRQPEDSSAEEEPRLNRLPSLRRRCVGVIV